MVEFIFESAVLLGGFGLWMLGAKAVLWFFGSEKHKAIRW